MRIWIAPMRAIVGIVSILLKMTYDGAAFLCSHYSADGLKFHYPTRSSPVSLGFAF
jgi:hypothetical protein